jgi:hypothetical protein
VAGVISPEHSVGVLVAPARCLSVGFAPLPSSQLDVTSSLLQVVFISRTKTLYTLHQFNFVTSMNEKRLHCLKDKPNGAFHVFEVRKPNNVETQE